MKAKIIKIGNSQGIRIPKLFLEQTGLGEEVDMEVIDDRIVIKPVSAPRQGWAESFEEMARAGEDGLLLGDEALTAWDEDEWEW